MCLKVRAGRVDCTMYKHACSCPINALFLPSPHASPLPLSKAPNSHPADEGAGVLTISRILNIYFPAEPIERQKMKQMGKGAGFSTVDSALSKNTFTRTSLGQFVWTREHNRHTHALQPIRLSGFLYNKARATATPLGGGGDRLLFGFLYPSEDGNKTNAPLHSSSEHQVKS